MNTKAKVDKVKLKVHYTQFKPKHFNLSTSSKAILFGSWPVISPRIQENLHACVLYNYDSSMKAQ